LVSITPERWYIAAAAGGGGNQSSSMLSMSQPGECRPWGSGVEEG
jgi:hypothetical protein